MPKSDPPRKLLGCTRTVWRGALEEKTLFAALAPRSPSLVVPSRDCRFMRGREQCPVLRKAWGDSPTTWAVQEGFQEEVAQNKASREAEWEMPL